MKGIAIETNFFLRRSSAGNSLLWIHRDRACPNADLTYTRARDNVDPWAFVALCIRPKVTAWQLPRLFTSTTINYPQSCRVLRTHTPSSSELPVYLYEA
ncbi:hypothetical protein ACN38_g3570 [Penicillium nordicum]|uniref:Uncharacterized protein n=1 Tax=Penicillium nordicum TaxID=229535 RepID=A0A0M8P5C9_9EURO|nr:hypothetical protein ACN38_g3570 [Penicillium nordicum]